VQRRNALPLSASAGGDTGPDTRARIGRTPNKPICVLHADDGEDLAAAQIESSLLSALSSGSLDFLR
jgi:hypothetical protein